MSRNTHALDYAALSGVSYTTALRASRMAPSWNPAPDAHLLVIAPPGAGGTAAIEYLLATSWLHDVGWQDMPERPVHPLARIEPDLVGGDALTVHHLGLHAVVVDPVPVHRLRHPGLKGETLQHLRFLLDEPHTLVVLRLEASRLEPGLLPVDIMERFTTVLELPDAARPGHGTLTRGITSREVVVPWHDSVPLVDFEWGQTPHLMVGGLRDDARMLGVQAALDSARARGAQVLHPAEGNELNAGWWRGPRLAELEKVVDDLLDTLRRRQAAMFHAQASTASEVGLREVFWFTGDITVLIDRWRQDEDMARIEQKMQVLLRQGRSAGIRVVGWVQNPDLRHVNSATSQSFARLLMGPSSPTQRRCFLPEPSSAERIGKVTRGQGILADGRTRMVRMG